MLSGRRLDLLDPSPLDVEIDDIAQGLSRVARWNGQTSGDWAFTVAQHSLLVEWLARRERPECAARWQLATLLHDAAEYVLGDLITPFKAVVGQDYKQVEARLSTAVRLRFGLPAALPQWVEAMIKRADRAAAYFEATQLAGFSVEEADAIFGRPKTVGIPSIAPLPPDRAKDDFLLRFRALEKASG